MNVVFMNIEKRTFDIIYQLEKSFHTSAKPHSVWLTSKHRAKVLNHLSNLDKNSKVLDIGMSIGYTTFPCANIFDFDMYAIEYPGIWYLEKPYFKEMCKKYNLKLSLCDITKEKFPFDDNYFDAILFTEVLEHIYPYFVPNVLKEINRVLKKGGILLLSTPNLYSIVRRIKFLLGLHTEYDISSKPVKHGGHTYYGVRGHIREYTEKELNFILEENGFEIRDVQMMNTPYGNKVIDKLLSVLTSFAPYLKNNIIIKAQPNQIKTLPKKS